ncbi:acyltransferase [Micromonospora sp. PSH03]|uniref:acyltransferase family protein n=1 Tax=Micromonospora salmantinae TaxID=2911211 RepID=UPI001EE833C0|nr:acyltransferase family protein [Micromonospora salmantinae]MCG5454248.1 acyltransferase [Micromonospora salmantinae]
MTRTAVRPEASPRAGFRGDVEGLRALAVILVLAGHAGQQLVPGGFVGVDVFFVISGYLITGLLVAEVNRTGRLSLIGFYARRAKRLLPAAVVVLIGSLLLTFAFLPRTRWSATGWDVVFSGLYAMNWRLAEQSVDYLAANQAPSILQHFWSLGVEEQFYLVWPLLLASAVWLGRRRYARTGYLLFALTLVAVPSFAWSVWLTEDNPARAYFVTTTRMWELALGGFLALLGGHLQRLPRLVAAALAWCGLAAIVASAVLLSEASAFPGYVALAPTLGTAAVIAGGLAAGGFGPAMLLALRPVRAVGAISYSLYLWHWPLLIAAEARFGELTTATGLAVAAISVVPAALTYRFIENPIRMSPTLTWEPARSLQLGAVCTGVALLAGLAFQLTVPPARAPMPPTLAVPTAGGSGVPVAASPTVLGASALGDSPASSDAGIPVDRVGPFVPDPLVASKDGPDAWRDGCHADQRSSAVRACQYGDPNASFTVALAGDSHAAQWLPALQRVAESKKWRLKSYTKSSCPFIDGEVALDSRPYPSCTEWNDKLRAQVTGAERPNVLVVSTSFYVMIQNGERVTSQAQAAFTDALRRTWAAMAAAGVPVIVLRDTPYHDRDIAECVSANPKKLTRCASPRDKVLAGGGGPAHEAAARSNNKVYLVDLNPAICPRERCSPVIGGVLVYRDNNHITATYAATLAPRLGTALDRVLG